MKMTRQRKVYAAVLLLGVGALAADKIFFSPPSTAAQDPSAMLLASTPHSPAPAAKHAVQPKEANLLGLGALADRMRKVAESERLDLGDSADVFRAPASWIQQKQSHEASQATTQPDPGAIFRDRHHLAAVLRSTHGGIAVLDATSGSKGRAIRIGQTLDGFKLIAVGERSATFASASGRVELELPADVGLDPQSITPSGR